MPDNIIIVNTSTTRAEISAPGPQGAVGNAADATTTNKGIVQLAGDLAGTATSPTVPELANKQPLDSDLTAIAVLTPSDDDVVQRKSGAWTNRTMAQVKTDLALTKSDVGLGNVDNTSDADKPVSTATQTALDGKQDEDQDLIDIAALTPSNDDFMQRKAGAWSNRTVAQVKTDLAYTASDVGAIATTLVDVKGDIIVASAADTVVRLPVGTNGHVLTADSGESSGVKWAESAGGAGGSMTGVYKSSNESVTSSTTLQNDDELTLAVNANSVYLFELTIFYTADVSGDIELGLVFPSGATIQVGALGANSGTITNLQSVTLADWFSNLGIVTFGGNGVSSGKVGKLYGVLVTAGTAGSLTLSWAQGTSNGNATTVRKGSHMTLLDIT